MSGLELDARRLNPAHSLSDVVLHPRGETSFIGSLAQSINIPEELLMISVLDRIIVRANCPTCGSQIGAPYVQVRRIKLFACGCGTVVGADMLSVETQAIIGLAAEGDAVPTGNASEPA